MLRGLKLVVLALLALAALDAVLSRGKSVPAGSYVDAKNGFSLAAPAGWHVLPPEYFGKAAAVNPALGQNDPELVAAPLRSGIAKAFGSFSRDSARKRNVDGLAAIELSGILSTRAGAQPVRLAQTVVPGDGRRYLITFLASSRRQEQDGPAYEAVLSSFRVLRRPSLF